MFLVKVLVVLAYALACGVMVSASVYWATCLAYCAYSRGDWFPPAGNLAIASAILFVVVRLSPSKKDLYQR